MPMINLHMSLLAVDTEAVTPPHAWTGKEVYHDF